MARYTGPRSRINRRFGGPIMGSTKALERRPFPPGVHGARKRKVSEYAEALAEKQKLKYAYGVLEKQFRLYYEKAKAKQGITGELMLQMLEMRVDNLVYRMGFAPTRRFARQMVNHGHILVNGRKVTIPSYGCKVGDVIEVRDHAKSRQIAAKNFDAAPLEITPEWLEVSRDDYRGKVSRVPTREEIAPIANEQLVVELYSRS